MSKSFTWKYEGITNTIWAPVKIANPFYSDSINSFKEYNAIWDTGSTKSTVSEKVINDLKLDKIGYENIEITSGTHEAAKYKANVLLLNGVEFVNMDVLCGKITDDEDVLIGMDIINRGDFVISNYDGNTVLSFRCPSICEIDFGRASREVVNRNDPCPCGSGDKYKKCCGNKTQQ